MTAADSVRSQFEAWAIAVYGRGDFDTELMWSAYQAGRRAGIEDAALYIENNRTQRPMTRPRFATAIRALKDKT